MNELNGRITALVASFPRIFKGSEPELGMATSEGWQPILEELFRGIDQLLSDEQAELFRIRQVKQKFGGLRVYYSVGESAETVVDIATPDGVLSFRTPPETTLPFPLE